RRGAGVEARAAAHLLPAQPAGGPLARGVARARGGQMKVAPGLAVRRPQAAGRRRGQAGTRAAPRRRVVRPAGVFHGRRQLVTPHSLRRACVPGEKGIQPIRKISLGS
ncbi:unnamed protein product, partial [Gulo gulo]